MINITVACAESQQLQSLQAMHCTAGDSEICQRGSAEGNVVSEWRRFVHVTSVDFIVLKLVLFTRTFVYRLFGARHPHKMAFTYDVIFRQALDTMFKTLPVFLRRWNIHSWSALRRTSVLSSVEQLAVVIVWQ